VLLLIKYKMSFQLCGITIFKTILSAPGITQLGTGILRLLRTAARSSGNVSKKPSIANFILDSTLSNVSASTITDISKHSATKVLSTYKKLDLGLYYLTL
jgi:hypothetical protein